MTQKSQHHFSLEQDEIIDLIVNQHRNVIVNGYAGFGKTTTALRIAEAMAKQDPKKKILILTYNKELQSETNNRLNTWGLHNTKCMTFHAYFGEQISHLFEHTINKKKIIQDDQKLINFLIQILKQNVSDEENGHPRNKQLRMIKIRDRHDLVILDEMQDCTLLFMIYLKKIISKSQQLLIMGDQHQTIYEYNNADNRYFRYINYFFPHDFVCVFANKSMRIKQIQANLINYAIAKGENLPQILGNNEWHLNRKKIQVMHDGGTVTYLANFSPVPKIKGIEKDVYYKNLSFVKNWLLDKLKTYKPGQIAILLSTVQENNPNLKSFLSGLLDEIGEPYTISNQDNTIAEQENKIVVSTYHQFKGRERECVILFNFSNEYFSQETLLTKKKISELNDVFYVGITRAKDHLLICENVIRHKDMIREKVRNRFNFFPDSFAKDCKKLGIEYHDFYTELFHKNASSDEDVSIEFDDDTYQKNLLMPGQLSKTSLSLHPYNVAKNLDSITLNKISKMIEDNHLLQRYAGEKIPFDLININFVEKCTEEVVSGEETEQESIVEQYVTRENVANFNSEYVTNEFWIRIGVPIYCYKWNWICKKIQNKRLQEDDLKTSKFHAFFTELKSEMLVWMAENGQPEMDNFDNSKLTKELKLKLIVLVNAIEKKETYILNQIDQYNWLDQKDLTPLVDRLYQFLAKFDIQKMRSEVPVRLDLVATECKEDSLDRFNELFHLNGLLKLHITGRIDFIVTDFWDHDPSGHMNAIVELKCVNDARMGITYIIQTMFYMLMDNLAQSQVLGYNAVTIGDGSWLEERKINLGYLYNVKSNELIIIQNNRAVIQEIFQIIFRAKLQQKSWQIEDDEQFIQTTKKLLDDDKQCLAFIENLIEEKKTT